MKNVANLKRRFLALLLDYLVIVAWGVVLFGVNMLIFFGFLDGLPSFDELGMNLLSLTMIVPVLLYSIILEASGKHATLGKRWQRIKVTSADKKPLRLWQVIVRNLVKFLPWQLAHMMIFHGFALNWEVSPLWLTILSMTYFIPIIWIGVVVFRKDHRGIHDLLAGSIVVNR